MEVACAVYRETIETVEAGAGQLSGHFGGIDEPLKVLFRAYGMTAGSTALPDGLFRDDVLRAVRHCDGYLDLLGPSVPTRLSLAQRAMRTPVVAAAYERVWRPIMIAIMRSHGVSVFCGAREGLVRIADRRRAEDPFFVALRGRVGQPVAALP